MKRKLFFLLCALLTTFSASVQKVEAAAADYLTGWTEVTSLPTSNEELEQYYYVFVATEADLMLAQEYGTGKISDGGDASNPQEGKLTVVYRTPSNPIIAKKFVWMLRYDATYLYGIRNLTNSTHYMQSRASWPWRVQFAWETAQSKWTKWQFAYNDSKWTIQNKLSSEDGGGDTYFIGPWIAKAFKDNNVVAGNKEGENVGKFKIYRISRQDFKAPTDVTSTYLTNPGFEYDNTTVADDQAAKEFATNWYAYKFEYARYGIYDSSSATLSYGTTTSSDGSYYLMIRNNMNDQQNTQHIQQKDAMTLPKGKYNISFDYKAAKAVDNALDLTIKALAGETTKGSKVIGIPKVTVSNTYFSSIGWAKSDFDFTLNSSTDIKLDITCDTRGNNDGASVALVDNFVVNYYNIDGPKLAALLVQANSINAVTGDLTSDIATAQAVYDGINNTPAYQTTIDGAITTLKNAIASSIAGITKNDGDDLSYLIANNGFESSSAITENKTTNTTIDYASTGWLALSTSTPNSCGAVAAYGSDKTLNGVTSPSVDNNGDSGNALGVSIGWNTTVAYQTAPITLPAGFYRLVVHGINRNSSGTSFESKFGFVPTEGDGFISSKTSFTYNTWETDEVEFTLAEATEGVFQIGGKAGNNTSTSHAKVFLDNISLTYYSDAVALEKMHLSEEITTANGISSSMSANVGTGVFQITTAAGTAFTTAIATAQGVYDDGDANVDEVTAAITTLQAAEETFVSTINAPDPEKRYCIVLNNNSEWTYDGKAITYIANGRNDMGLYNIQYQAAPNSNYAQAFILIQVTGNTYKMSQTDVDGNTRYICTGVPYSGNTGQIRTTTDASDALVVKIIPTSTEGVFNIYNTEASNYIGSQDAGVYTVNNHINFTIQEATQATPNLTVAANVNWATFMSPFAVSLSSLDDVTAFRITDVENDELTTEEVSTKIPANTPVLLYRKTTGSNYAPALSGYGTAYQDSYVSGLLTGSFVKSSVTGGENHYLLQKNNNVVAFYNVTASGLYIGAYRAYLTMPAASARPVIYFPGEDGPTAINAIEATETEGLKDGKYLIGGKIVMVKNKVKYNANGQKMK